MPDITCIHTNPLNGDGTAPLNREPFQFSESTCTQETATSSATTLLLDQENYYEVAIQPLEFAVLTVVFLLTGIVVSLLFKE